MNQCLNVFNTLLPETDRVRPNALYMSELSEPILRVIYVVNRRSLQQKKHRLFCQKVNCIK